MSKEAEKLAAALDSRVVRNWVHSTGTSPKSTGFKHDAECQQAAALLLRQAEQIKVMREALGLAYDALSGSTDKTLLPRAHRAVEQALAATKEET